MGDGKGSNADRIAAWRWEKGVSGNLRGRPRKRVLSTEYESVLESPAPPEVVKALARWGAKPGATWSRCIALSQARNALMTAAGATLAARELREGVEGKAAKRVVTEAESRVEILVTYDDPPPDTRPMLNDEPIDV